MMQLQPAGREDTLTGYPSGRAGPCLKQPRHIVCGSCENLLLADPVNEAAGPTSSVVRARQMVAVVLPTSTEGCSGRQRTGPKVKLRVPRRHCHHCKHDVSRLFVGHLGGEEVGTCAGERSQVMRNSEEHFYGRNVRCNPRQFHIFEFGSPQAGPPRAFPGPPSRERDNAYYVHECWVQGRRRQPGQGPHHRGRGCRLPGFRGR